MSLVQHMNYSLILYHLFEHILQYFIDLKNEKSLLLPAAWRIAGHLYYSDLYSPDLLGMAAVHVSMTLEQINIDDWFSQMNDDTKDCNGDHSPCDGVL